MVIGQNLFRRSPKRRVGKSTRPSLTHVNNKDHLAQKKRRNNAKSFYMKVYSISTLAVVLYLLALYVLMNTNMNKDPPKHTINDYLKRVRESQSTRDGGYHLLRYLDRVKEKSQPSSLSENNRTTFQINELPSHCHSSPKNFSEIIIKGERHSGTNWVRALMEKNVESSINVNQTSLDIGWKHGFLPPLGWGKPIEENELLIVVTRDVFTWLPKMHRMSYDPEMNEKGSKRFADFIRTDYTARCHPLPKDTKYRKQSHYQVPFCNAFAKTWSEKLFYDPNKVIAERALNVIQIRTQKYKQWLSEEPSNEMFQGSRETFLKQRIHLSLENLTSHERKDVVGDELTSHCVPVYKEFQDIIERTKWKGFKGSKEGRPYDSVKEKHKMLRKYSKTDLRYVLSQLDLEFERKLGYTYDYVYALLKSDEIPEDFRSKHRVHRQDGHRPKRQGKTKTKSVRG